MTPRLLIRGMCSTADEIDLDDAQRHYLQQVLRLTQGAGVQIFNGEGRRFEATVVESARRNVRIRIERPIEALNESALSISLIQSIGAAERMDWCIEKATELGVTRLRPLLASRTRVKLDPDRANRRHEHWQRLIIAACMQCGRDHLPKLDIAATLDDIAQSPASNGPRLVLTPPSDPVATCFLSRSLSDWLDDHPRNTVNHIEILIGPESGLSASEQTRALNAGFEAITLGPRILRTETAGLAVIAALQSRLGDF